MGRMNESTLVTVAGIGDGLPNRIDFDSPESIRARPTGNSTGTSNPSGPYPMAKSTASIFPRSVGPLPTRPSATDASSSSQNRSAGMPG